MSGAPHGIVTYHDGFNFGAYLQTYAATANTYAAIYNGVMQRGWFTAQARNYPNTLEAALDSNNIPPAVVQTLVDAVRKGTAPLQRYHKLRQKLLARHARCTQHQPEVIEAARNLGSLRIGA